MNVPTRSLSDSTYAETIAPSSPSPPHERDADVEHEGEPAQDREERAEPHEVHGDQRLGVRPAEAEGLPRGAVAPRPVHPRHDPGEAETVEIGLPARHARAPEGAARDLEEERGQAHV